MKKPLIYAVEDDAGIRELYEGAFEELYDIKLFASAAEFFEQFAQKKPSLCILDIMLPDMDGYQILSKIRAEDERLPVIFVSAKSDEMSFVKGLNKGADDYMAKPFSVLELLARVKANLRRTDSGLVTQSAGFVVDKSNYTVLYAGTNLGLTLKEFQLIEILAKNVGITVTRETLFQQAWDTDYIGETRTLDMHMSALRDKILKAGGKNAIITVRGVGYRLEKQ